VIETHLTLYDCSHRSTLPTQYEALKMTDLGYVYWNMKDWKIQA